MIKQLSNILMIAAVVIFASCAMWLLDTQEAARIICGAAFLILIFLLFLFVGLEKFCGNGRKL